MNNPGALIDMMQYVQVVVLMFARYGEQGGMPK